MEMVDMKLPKRKKEDMKTAGMPMDMPQDQWPYGLKITLEKEQIDKLPSVKGYNVGDYVFIEAEACVVSMRKSEQKGGKDHYSVELQIEKISLKDKKPLEKMSMKEYREEREKKY
jgi:hypothetical protein